MNSVVAAIATVLLTGFPSSAQSTADRGGREVVLTAKEFRLLAYFAAQPGRALTRNDILNAVWGRARS